MVPASCVRRVLSTSARWCHSGHGHTAAGSGECDDGDARVDILRVDTPGNRAALLDTLRAAVTLHEPGRMLVLTKPYGIGCFGHGRGGVFKRRRAPDDDYGEPDARHTIDPSRNPPPAHMTLESCCGELMHTFDEQQMIIAKAIPRSMSGPVILACDEATLHRTQSAISSASGHKYDTPFMRALVICAGVPQPAEGADLIAAHHTTVGGVRVNAIWPDAKGVSRRARQRGLVKRDYCTHRTLAVARGGVASLVELGFNKFSLFLPRFYLAVQGAPALGDTMAELHVQRILGQPVVVAPSASAMLGGTKRHVDRWLLSALRIGADDYVRSLPLYLHVSRVDLPATGRRSRRRGAPPLVLRAPPPAHFVHCLRRLRLDHAFHDYELGQDAQIEAMFCATHH